MQRRGRACTTEPELSARRRLQLVNALASLVFSCVWGAAQAPAELVSGGHKGVRPPSSILKRTSASPRRQFQPFGSAAAPLSPAWNLRLFLHPTSPGVVSQDRLRLLQVRPSKMSFSRRAYQVCKVVRREEIVLRYILEHDVGDLKAETVALSRTPLTKGRTELQRTSHKRAILVTGAFGQIGSELVPLLQRRYGIENVIASDLRRPARCAANKVRIETLDCIDTEAILDAVRRHNIGTIYHLAAMLSATAEREPQIAWRLNMGGLHNVLEAARQYGCRVFFPSTIGAFGPSRPREQTPQVTIQRPATLYGVTKVAGELLCDYYASRYGLDTRGLRLPGVISYKTAPAGGRTDYAIEIFHYAVHGETYPRFL